MVTLNEKQLLRPDDAANYSDANFWSKIRDACRLADRVVIEVAFGLYFALQSERTPDAVKLSIMAALAYFIVPVDAIPDFIPAIGYSDDLTVMLACSNAFCKWVNADCKSKGKQKAIEWLGEETFFSKEP